MILVVSAALGAASWSLSEYLIHRWLGHYRPLLRNPFGVEHTAHHSRGNWFAPTWKKALAAVAVTAVVWPLASLAVGPVVAAAYTAGYLGLYITYEVIHRLEHVTAGVGPYARWARRHHFHHHFHDPSSNHGVTSPIWDWVFGTYTPVTHVRVPEKLAMTWLCDPETGEVWPQHRAVYSLRRKGRAAPSYSGAGSATCRARA